jgi:hypothetical protein
VGLNLPNQYKPYAIACMGFVSLKHFMNTISTPVSLEHLLKAAKQAHSGTSFSPEKRGEDMIKSYEELLTADLEQISAASTAIKEQYRERFTKHLSHFIAAKSRIISPMISGPSNFPTARMKKYNNWEENAYKKFEHFRSKALAGIKKQIELSKPHEQKIDEAWQLIESKILYSARVIVGIDNGTEPYTRALFVSGITGLITRLANNGHSEHVRRALELIRKLNSAHTKPIVTERNAIFKLAVAAAVVADKKETQANKESDSYPFAGGVVLINYQDERIQVKYDVDRVPAELYQKLTRELHFRHSRTNKAFQLYINNQSINKVNQFLGLQIPYLK